MNSEQARLLAAQRKTHAGKAKKLEVCSHCGELLGVRERRAHGDVGERAKQAEYQRKLTERKRTK